MGDRGGSGNRTNPPFGIDRELRSGLCSQTAQRAPSSWTSSWRLPIPNANGSCPIRLPPLRCRYQVPQRYLSAAPGRPRPTSGPGCTCGASATGGCRRCSRPWNDSRRSSTACMPGWTGPQCRRSGYRGVAVDSPVLGAQRARLLRGTRIQPALSPVPGHGPDGAQLRCRRLHPEPTAVAGARRGPGPVRRDGVGSRRGRAAVGRARQRGRDPDRGRGQSQELPVQGGTATAVG